MVKKACKIYNNFYLQKLEALLDFFLGRGYYLSLIIFRGLLISKRR